MVTINSVLGDLDTADLGFTLTHEHVWQSAAGINATYPEFFDRQAVVDSAVTQLRAVHDEGVRTIVDVTPMDLGRDETLTKDVALRSGINVIAATGFWVDVPRIFWDADPDDVPSGWRLHEPLARWLDPDDDSTWGKVPRNAPCPCGAGRKYKHCHGKLT